MPIIIRSYRDDDRDDVVALWESCGLLRAWNDPDKDIRRKQAVQSHLFLLKPDVSQSKRESTFTHPGKAAPRLPLDCIAEMSS